MSKCPLALLGCSTWIPILLLLPALPGLHLALPHPHANYYVAMLCVVLVQSDTWKTLAVPADPDPGAGKHFGESATHASLQRSTTTLSPTHDIACPFGYLRLPGLKLQPV